MMDSICLPPLKYRNFSIFMKEVCKKNIFMTKRKEDVARSMLETQLMLVPVFAVVAD